MVLLVATALTVVLAARPATPRVRRLFEQPARSASTTGTLRTVPATQVAEVADVLALCLAMGADLLSALRALAAAGAADVTPHLQRTIALVEVQASVPEAWRHWGPAAQPLVQAFERSLRTGAPIADECTRVAAALRDEQLASVQRQARGVGVRAVLPLMVCFLPAFVLVGIVPVIASLISGLLAST